jgi:hypothetical protein
MTDVHDKCDPSIGYHVVLPDSDACQCGERKRTNAPPTEEDSLKNILGCARCGGEHLVRFKELRIPITIGDTTLTHWGMCPTTKEPILMRFVEAPQDVERD